jgi:hypothetical protein
LIFISILIFKDYDERTSLLDYVHETPHRRAG